MINWWLVSIAVICGLLTVGVALYIVVIFTRQSDRVGALFPKGVALMGLTLACFTVLLLPFDVANRKDNTDVQSVGGGIDVALLWVIILWAVAAFVVVIIPFATFFYEAHDPDHFSCVQQVAPALCYTLLFVILFLGITVVLWLTVGYADIPYYSYTSAPNILATDPLHTADVFLEYTKTIQVLELAVSFFVYVVGVMTVLGWVLFAIYGGVGLSALPVDIMGEWHLMPKKAPTKLEYEAECESIAVKAHELTKAGKKLQHDQLVKNGSKAQRMVNAFKAEVHECEGSIARLNSAYEDRTMLPFKLVGLFMVAVLASILTVLWVLQIFLYNFLRVSIFLNAVLIALDEAFELLGVMCYALLAFYLLWCTVAGCVKVGMRVVFFQIHPMRLGDTPVNSLLFNTGLILLSSVTVTQFCALSFNVYASNTAIDTLLNLYVRRLRGIGVVTIYFQFVFLVVAFLSIFWVLACPRPKPKKSEEDME
jgi:LMBR1 domain-containing protein 1